MADVRSLLRAERAARAPPKSRKQVPAPSSPPKPNKKRKADDSEPTTAETRKRTKAKGATNLPSGFFDGVEGEGNEEEQDEGIEEPQEPLEGFVAATEAPPILPQSSIPDVPSIDLDDEWAAFEQDMASMPAEAKTALDALNANAVLEAAPVSATEIDLRTLDPPNPLKRREEEIEAEKEDASRALEEEFEEMEVLGERLKRLKEKREQLRASKAEVINHIEVEPEPVPGDGSDDEDDDEADEWDGWRFGAL
ncbi:hypothetical protein EG328_009129 [Venturia inaequalis]|uniref:Uncharacterized protein n=1 Tax=Venturia inaequalis TaxID=5025 RepID=A0A8H3V7H0_VENIN|nr:hypothetical protein EG328_009129 [Venturia inaequalis]KAE9983465.1 hypothetical protein EG327_005455 [Venturia inaequalis]RDI77924.1 hypothetical protein Vi05172_g12187 [Venturia inaequalis]